MQAGTPPDAVYAQEGASAKEVSAILRNDSIKERGSSGRDEVLTYFHGLAFQADPRTALPTALEGDDRALALRDALLQVRTTLKRMHEGDLDGRIDADFGVTTVPSFLMKRKFAPPVSSTCVRVAASRNIFSSNPAACAAI